MGGSFGLSLWWTVPLPVGSVAEPATFRNTSLSLGNLSQSPVYLAVGRNGSLYLADGTAIHEIGVDGSVSIVADLSAYGISVGGMAVDELGRIWFSDPKHRRVRLLEAVR